MTTLAGKRLSEMLEDNIDGGKPHGPGLRCCGALSSGHAPLRDFGGKPDSRLTVKWNGQEATESVQMLA